MAVQLAIECLLRIMEKAKSVAEEPETNYEDLAKAYENAIFKELADLTQFKEEEG